MCNENEMIMKMILMVVKCECNEMMEKTSRRNERKWNEKCRRRANHRDNEISAWLA